MIFSQCQKSLESTSRFLSTTFEFSWPKYLRFCKIKNALMFRRVAASVFSEKNRQSSLLVTKAVVPEVQSLWGFLGGPVLANFLDLLPFFFNVPTTHAFLFFQEHPSARSGAESSRLSNIDRQSEKWQHNEKFTAFCSTMRLRKNGPLTRDLPFNFRDKTRVQLLKNGSNISWCERSEHSCSPTLRLVLEHQMIRNDGDPDLNAKSETIIFRGSFQVTQLELRIFLNHEKIPMIIEPPQPPIRSGDDLDFDSYTQSQLDQSMIIIARRICGQIRFNDLIH